MEYPHQDKSKGSETYIRTCRACGEEIPAGGTRRVGICVWCVAKSEHSVGTTIPRQSYGTS